MDTTESASSGGIRAYLELMRPANIVTAFADILAGFAAAGGVALFSQVFPPEITPELIGLLIATFGLYGGGVVFNDVFDAGLDAEERPERAIPSGRISKNNAIRLGTILLMAGIIFAFMVSTRSGILAVVIALCALFYDAKAKHSSLWGPLFMGLCRGGNLLLGCSIIPAVIPQVWFIGFIPVVYIGSITLVSQGEVHGGKKAPGYLALGLILLVTAVLFLLAILPYYALPEATPFVILFAIMVIPPFFKAASHPTPEFIKAAVKRGVLSLIILNSALAAGFSGFTLGILTLLLLPVSILLARIFAVT